MSNPVFNDSAVFGDPRQQRRGGSRPSCRAPRGARPVRTAADAATLEQMYDAAAGHPA